MLYAVGGLGGTDAVCVVLEGQGRRTVDRCKLSAVLPSEGVAQPVVVGERVADGINNPIEGRLLPSIGPY